MTLYLVCYDLALPRGEQLAQISYWLDFLCSSLPIPSQGAPNSTWNIMLVGLRMDMQVPSSQFTSEHLASWQRQWDCLPLHNQLFFVSSTTDEGVRGLFEAVSQACGEIFTSHATQIPTLYQQQLKRLRQHSAGKHVIFSVDELFNLYGTEMDQSTFLFMLQYFHEIGQIALLKERMVCLNIQHIAKIAANFISPEEVQTHLLNKVDSEGTLQIISQENVGFLLNIAKLNKTQYVIKLVMQFVID